jgi:hypothetical protein
MEPRDEARSLVNQPLPPQGLVRTEKDASLPSQILKTDKHIADLEEMLRDQRDLRDMLLERAIRLQVGEDSEAIIIRNEKNLPRKINLKAFREKYPEAYDKALTAAFEEARIAIEESIKHLGDSVNKINLKTAKKFLGEHDVDDVCYPHEIQTTYEVISTKTPMPKGKGITKLVETIL